MNSFLDIWRLHLKKLKNYEIFVQDKKQTNPIESDDFFHKIQKNY